MGDLYDETQKRTMSDYRKKSVEASADIFRHTHFSCPCLERNRQEPGRTDSFCASSGHVFSTAGVRRTLSLSKTGRIFGDRSAATVSYAFTTIGNELKINPEMSEAVEKISEKIHRETSTSLRT